MGFTEVLTLIFITLKLTGYIDWSWWWVLSPAIITLVIVVIYLSNTTPSDRAINKRYFKK